MMQAVWVEIPVRDLDRAATFYRTVFGLPAGEITDDGSRRTVTLVNTSPEGGVGISLNQTANFEPSGKGTLVYFQVEGEALERVETAGGNIIQAKTSMGEAGTYAIVQDSEGNLLAFYFYP